MSLIDNPNLKKNKHKHDPLDRGEDIKPKQTFSIDDLGDSKNEKKTPKLNVKTDSVTVYTSVRVNNHIKNKAEALSSIGLASSQKDAIDIALDNYIQSLSEEDRTRLKFQIETLEERDVRASRRNANK